MLPGNWGSEGEKRKGDGGGEKEPEGTKWGKYTSQLLEPDRIVMHERDIYEMYKHFLDLRRLKMTKFYRIYVLVLANNSF